MISDTKTASGKRSIPVPDAVMKELKKQKARVSADRLKAGDAWEDNDFVFPGVNGRRRHPDAFVKNFKRTLKRAGLPMISFHDMRHSHATLLLLMGEHPAIVKERLGHADISTTIYTYTHVLPSMQKKVAARLGDMLKEARR